MAYKIPKKRYCFVYKTTNLLNQKYYIGCHCTYRLNDGYLGSGMRIQRSVAKYGRENFKLEILEFLESREQALLREKELVTEQLLKDPMCMNIQLGGTGGWTVDQQRQLANRSVQKRRSENRMKMPDWSGRKHSERTKELMRTSHIGKHTGTRNSQFGSCWVQKNGTSMKIKRVDLDQFLKDGWSLGRKMTKRV